MVDFRNENEKEAWLEQWLRAKQKSWAQRGLGKDFAFHFK